MGAEVLYHARFEIEGVVATGAMAPTAIIMVDLVNCFPSIERRACTQAYHEELTSMEAWDMWADSKEMEAQPEGRGRILINRGVGQGELDVTLKGSVTMGSNVSKQRGFALNPLTSECVDVCFMDDGQIIARPLQVDGVLRAVDRAMG